MPEFKRVISAFFACVALFVPGLAHGRSVAQDIAGLIKSGQYDVAAAQLSDPSLTQSERLFLQARIYRKTGRYIQAIAAYREVLRLSPDSIVARQELGQTLLLAREYGPAAFHFRELERIDPRENAQRMYRAYLNRIAREKPIGISGGFSFVPSSNINLGTYNTIFDTPIGEFVISQDKQEMSGVGLAVNLAGYFRKSLGDVSTLGLEWGLNGVHYPTQSSLSSLTGAVSLAFVTRDDGGKWRIAPHVWQTWQEGSNTFAYGLKLGRSGQFTDSLRYSLSFNFEDRRYQNNLGKSGPYGSVDLKLAQQINPTLSLTYGIATRFNRPEDAHRKFNEFEISAGFRKAWDGGLTTAVMLSGGYRGFLGDYPYLSRPRADHFAKIGISVQNSRINFRGFTPKLSCSYQINSSNVAFYDYDANKCAVGFSKNF